MNQLTLPLHGECRCAKVTLRITAAPLVTPAVRSYPSFPPLDEFPQLIEAYAKLRA